MGAGIQAAASLSPALLGCIKHSRHHTVACTHIPLHCPAPLPPHQVMEYLPGGDMMTLLIRKEILPEDWARFYLAQVGLVWV